MNNERRGWCPSLFRPMETGDGWLCRVKPFLGTLDSQQARFIAQAAKDYGNGFINLSQKANLQLRGFTPENIKKFIPLAQHQKLCSSDSLQEGKRNLLLSPLAAIDPTCHRNTLEFAQNLYRTIIKNEKIHFLSGKFSFIIDGGGLFPLTHHYADINIRFYHNHWVLQIGHAQQVIPCTPENFSTIIQNILQFCQENNLKRLIHHEETKFYLQHTAYPTEFYKIPVPHDELPIGSFSLGYHIGIPFGLLTCEDLKLLADISEDYGKSILRFTPCRSIIIPHCSNKAYPYLKRFINDPHDPRLSIILCPGKPYCLQGQQPILHDVQKLIPVWQNRNQILHISGCAKGCASPQKNPFTLCATSQGYNLILHGKAHDKSLNQNLNLTDIATHLINHHDLY